jgi:tetratricopeptide (TPR) repeat protein
MSQAKTGRNDPCPCGSGKKFKQCCAMKQSASHSAAFNVDIQIQQAIRQAWMLQTTGRQVEAEGICKQIFSIRPNYPEAMHLLGVMALRDGNIPDAIVALTKASQGVVTNPQFKCNLGLAYHEQGQLDQAIKYYRQALKLHSDYADAYYNLHAAQLDADDLTHAIESLQKLLVITPNDLDGRLMLGVLLEYRGDAVHQDQDEAAQQFSHLGAPSGIYAARLDAWRYLKSACSTLPPITGSNIGTFRLAVDAAELQGLVLEFGVRHGNTIRQIADLVGQEVHGFDSFEGLPEQWHHEPKGSYTTKGRIPHVPQQVKLHVGWFEETLPAFLLQHPGNIRLVNIDCDIYSSTKTILDALAPRIVSGSVLIFDEYIGNEHWRLDEFKAFQEAVARYGWDYEYLSFSFFTKQVTVRIK